MLAPKWRFEIVSDELDGSVEAFVRRDFGWTWGGVNCIRHVFPIVGGACALAVVLSG